MTAVAPMTSIRRKSFRLVAFAVFVAGAMAVFIGYAGVDADNALPTEVSTVGLRSPNSLPKEFGGMRRAGYDYEPEIIFQPNHPN